jgi:5-formyltetrahydrofolate cyclo-ligase
MTKYSIRKSALAKRKAMSPEEVAQKSAQICTQFLSHIVLKDIHAIHIFLPITHQNEVNTFLLIEKLRILHPTIHIIVPKIIKGTNEMLAIPFTKDCDIFINEWGIPEPSHQQIFDPKKIDLIIVPLLAFDLKGHRIGYGRGFYDKFLDACQPQILKIGLAFDTPTTEILAIESHDKPMDFIICPDHVYHITKKNPDV